MNHSGSPTGSGKNMTLEAQTIKHAQIQASCDSNEILGEILGFRFREYRKKRTWAESGR